MSFYFDVYDGAELAGRFTRLDGAERCAAKLMTYTGLVSFAAHAARRTRVKIRYVAPEAVVVPERFWIRLVDRAAT